MLDSEALGEEVPSRPGVALRCYHPESVGIVAEIHAEGPEQYANTLSFHSRLPLALTAGGSETIEVWNLDDLSVQSLTLDTKARVAALHPFDPVVALLMGTYQQPVQLRVVDLQNGDALQVWDGPDFQTAQMAFLNSTTLI